MRTIKTTKDSSSSNGMFHRLALGLITVSLLASCTTAKFTPMPPQAMDNATINSLQQAPLTMSPHEAVQFLAPRLRGGSKTTGFSISYKIDTDGLELFASMAPKIKQNMVNGVLTGERWVEDSGRRYYQKLSWADVKSIEVIRQNISGSEYIRISPQGFTWTVKNEENHSTLADNPTAYEGGWQITSEGPIPNSSYELIYVQQQPGAPPAEMKTRNVVPREELARCVEALRVLTGDKPVTTQL